jgi:farnesyl diphosphate synthase
MDTSVTRRGAPCWYRLPKVGMIAINDAFLLQAHLYRVLRKHFAGKPEYLQLLELFNQTTWETELGQLLDLTSQPQPAVGSIDLDRFTIERYNLIVKYKTAFYSFVLPVACGLVLGGLGPAADSAGFRDILLLMGEYFQVQDDYLDCYADPATLGKIGTDIQDNKCGWLVVQALAKATAAQKAVLIANYGQHDDAKVATIKTLYVEMGIEQLYIDYEDSTYAKLQQMIKDVCASTAIPAEVFESLLGKIYKRLK